MSAAIWEAIWRRMNAPGVRWFDVEFGTLDEAPAYGLDLCASCMAALGLSA